MGILNSLFGNQERTSSSGFPWTALTSTGQLIEAIEASHNEPVVVFKHSTRCSISRFALKQFEQEYRSDAAAALYYLDLLEYRDVSNAIAETLGVQHQSPQVIVLRDGTAVYHSSHENIEAKVVIAHF